MDDTLNDKSSDDELKDGLDLIPNSSNSETGDTSLDEEIPTSEIDNNDMDETQNVSDELSNSETSDEIIGGNKIETLNPQNKTEIVGSEKVIADSTISAGAGVQVGDNKTTNSNTTTTNITNNFIVPESAPKENDKKNKNPYNPKGFAEEFNNLEKKQKHELKDFTELVKSDISDVCKIDFSEFEPYCEKLNEKRFLIINCVDNKILNGLQNRVVKYFGGYNGAYEIRSLSYKKINDESDEIESLGLSIFKDRQVGSGRKTITFIENPSIPFIKNIHFGANYFNNFITHLKDNEMMIVCLMSNSKNEINKELSDFRRYILGVPFLEPFIKKYFEEEEDALRIIKKINESKLQRNFSDRGLYERLKEELEERYNEFENFIDEDNEVILKNESDYQLLIEAFNSKDRIKKIVLFVGAYFKNLNYRDFEAIVNFFLEGDTEIIKKKRKGKKKKREEEVSLKKRWHDKDDKILDKCQLVFIEHNGEHIMQFEHVDFQGRLKKHIKKKGMPIVQKQLDKIKKANLLFNFDFNISNRLMSNIIHLFIESTKYEIDIYNKDWLIGLVLQLKNVLEKHEQVSLNLSGDSYTQFIELLKLMEKGSRLNQLKKQFFRRLVELIHEMFEQDFDRFKKVVDEFIQGLIDKNLGKFSLEIVLEIFRTLKRDERFDTKKWLQHILHQEKDQQIREDTYKSMVKIFELDELKEIMDSLLPEKEGMIKNNLNAFAIRFQIDYCRETILSYDQSRVGIIPTEYELFSQLEDTDSQKNKELAEILEWIYDEKTDYVFEKYFANLKNWNKTDFMAEVIEIWFVILYGLEPLSPVPPGKKLLIENLLQLIIKSAGIKNSRQIVKYWVTKIPNAYGGAIEEESQKLAGETERTRHGNEVITVNIVKSRKEKEEILNTINDIKNRRSVLKILIKETNFQINKMKNHVK
jgi:hypothetical protein